MATLKYLSQYFTTALNVGGGIDDSQTTGIILLDVSGVTDISKPGQICITYSDPIDTSVAEWIDYTSINGSNELVGAVRGREGYSAHAHLQRATVAFVFSASHHNDIVDQLNGTETGTTLTSPVINTGFSGTAKATAAEVATGTDDAKIVTPLAATGIDTRTATFTNKTLTSPIISGAGGTTGGQHGWDQDNLNFKVGDGTANQIIHVSAWTAFTPAWGGITEGSGTNTGAYCVLGKTCHFRAGFIFAADSSATGNISLTLPLTKATGYNGTFESTIGNVVLYDTGTGNFQAVLSSNGVIYSLSVAGANVIRATVNATAPFTWANTDVIMVAGTYEIA